jgi:hypothetical protein
MRWQTSNPSTLRRETGDLGWRAERQRGRASHTVRRRKDSSRVENASAPRALRRCVIQTEHSGRQPRVRRGPVRGPNHRPGVDLGRRRSRLRQRLSERQAHERDLFRLVDDDLCAITFSCWFWPQRSSPSAMSITPWWCSTIVTRNFHERAAWEAYVRGQRPSFDPK